MSVSVNLRNATVWRDKRWEAGHGRQTANQERAAKEEVWEVFWWGVYTISVLLFRCQSFLSHVNDTLSNSISFRGATIEVVWFNNNTPFCCRLAMIGRIWYGFSRCNLLCKLKGLGFTGRGCMPYVGAFQLQLFACGETQSSLFQVLFLYACKYVTAFICCWTVQYRLTYSPLQTLMNLCCSASTNERPQTYSGLQLTQTNVLINHIWVAFCCMHTNSLCRQQKGWDIGLHVHPLTIGCTGSPETLAVASSG